MQPWAQNQEPTQLTWTAQHNTPQGLVTSWGGYTTHTTPPKPSHHTHRLSTMPHTRNSHHRRRCPPSPNSTLSLHPPPDSTTLPPFPRTRTRHTGVWGGQQHQPRPPTGRAPPRREHMTGTAIPGTTRKTTQTMRAPSPPPVQSNTAAQPTAWLPPPGTGPLPHMLQPEYTQWISSGDSKHTLTGCAPPNPPTRLPEDHTHITQPHQSSTSHKAALRHRSQQWTPNHLRTLSNSNLPNPPMSKQTRLTPPPLPLRPPPPTWSHPGRRCRPRPPTPRCLRDHRTHPQHRNSSLETAQLGEAVGGHALLSARLSLPGQPCPNSWTWQPTSWQQTGKVQL